MLSHCSGKQWAEVIKVMKVRLVKDMGGRMKIGNSAVEGCIAELRN